MHTTKKIPAITYFILIRDMPLSNSKKMLYSTVPEYPEQSNTYVMRSSLYMMMNLVQMLLHNPLKLSVHTIPLNI